MLGVCRLRMAGAGDRGVGTLLKAAAAAAPLSRHGRQHRHSHVNETSLHSAAAAIPQLQQQQRRPAPARRVSVLTALRDAPALASEDGDNEAAAAAATTSGRDLAPSASPSSSLADADATTAAMASYVQPSSFERQFRQHRRSSPAPNTNATGATNSSSSSMEEMRQQQAALRGAYEYADKHHRIRHRKSSAVYRAEVASFRAAHNDRSPTPAEVSPFTDVSLPPVAVLNALRHLDPKKSSIYREVQESVLLQQTITRSELLKSNERTLVRCFGCFHVYGARPRELWGGKGSSDSSSSRHSHQQQSWIALEREKKIVAEATAIMKRPGLGKKIGSVGRRQQRAADSPTACPKCGSPRAQWAMEYVHYRTHAK